MKKNKIIKNCIFVELHGKIAHEFAQYVIKNWNEMPNFRGAIIQGDYYYGFFLSEAYEKIIHFFNENKIKFDTNE